MMQGSSLVPRERSLALACEAGAIGTWQWDMLADQLHYDSVARSICGIPGEGPVPREIVRNLVHEEDRDQVAQASAAALDPARRTPAIYLCRFRRPSDGAVRWMRATGIAEFDRSGPDARPVHYLGTVQDITTEQEHAARLAESEARLRVAMDAAGLAVWELDMATGQLTPSPELNRLLQFPEDARPTIEEVRARYAPGERERVVAEGDAIRASGGDRIQTTARFLMPDGTERHLLIRAQVAPSSGGPSPRVIGVLQDVTRARQREHRLELLNRELRHRLLNLISIISAIVRRTLQGTERLPIVEGRLQAFGEGIQAMLREREEAADIGDLLSRVILPFDDRDRIVCAGPPLALAPASATAFALAAHELATNALKYGGLRDPQGRVSVTWTETGGRGRVVWEETLSRPLPKPERTGFGSALITKLLFHPPDHAQVEFREHGVRCVIDLTIESTTASIAAGS